MSQRKYSPGFSAAATRKRASVTFSATEVELVKCVLSRYICYVLDLNIPEFLVILILA